MTSYLYVIFKCTKLHLKNKTHILPLHTTSYQSLIHVLLMRFLTNDFILTCMHEYKISQKDHTIGNIMHLISLLDFLNGID